VRLLCIPHAGGSAAAFRTWGRWLPPGIELQALELPGRGARWSERLLTDIEALLDDLESAAEGAGEDFALFGHSVGALITFELARHLERRGGPCPQRLFVSARRAPHLPSPRRPTFSLTDRDLVRAVHDFNGTPEEVLGDSQLLDLMLPVIRADLAIDETYEYRPGPPLRCPISALGGIADAVVTRQELAAWQSHTSDRFTLRMVEGDHFFIRSQEPVVVQLVAGDLEATQMSWTA
jgi:medium-chain acyl-[acyl-carrier-protein] hydrolase